MIRELTHSLPSLPSLGKLWVSSLSNGEGGWAATGLLCERELAALREALLGLGRIVALHHLLILFIP